MNDDSVLDKSRTQRSDVSMSSKPDMRKPSSTGRETGHKPVWADGLKRMYDSVVEEDIPDDLVDLLKKLDDAGEKS